MHIGLFVFLIGSQKRARQNPPRGGGAGLFAATLLGPAAEDYALMTPQAVAIKRCGIRDIPI